MSDDITTPEEPTAIQLLGQTMLLAEIMRVREQMRVIGFSSRFDCALREYLRTEAIYTGTIVMSAIRERGILDESDPTLSEGVDVITRLIDTDNTCTCGMHDERKGQ